MFSKSMPERSAPQPGIGFLRKISYAFRRKSSIHSGSCLCAEIWRTMSSDRPRSTLMTGFDSSWKPYLYPSPIPAIAAASFSIADMSDLRHVRCVAGRLELVRQLGPAGADDPAVDQHVHVARRDVVEDP